MVNPIEGHALEWTSKGGNNESSIGANCHLYTYRYPKKNGEGFHEDKLIVDAGSGSGDKGAWGYHRILPDIINDLKDADKIILTHAHGDHIEALYYYLLSPMLTARGGLEMGFDLPPIWGTPYTIEKTKQFFTTRVGRVLASKDIPDYIKADVKKRYDDAMDKMSVFLPGQNIRVGKEMHVRAISMSHNTLHCVALLIQTPTATVFHSGDFNVDQTYKQPGCVDFDELKMLAEKGIDVAMIDSTGSDKETPDIFEAEIKENLVDLVKQHPTKRAVFTVMGGHDQRLISLMDVARETGRELQVAGTAMQLTFDVFKNRGIIPADLKVHYITKAGQEDRVPPENALLISTGSQGENKTPFVRSVIERGYRMIKLDPKKDVVIFSSSMLSINRARYQPVLNALKNRGFTFYYPGNTDKKLNAHGHARAPGIRKVLRALKPTYGFPVHGMSDGRDEGRPKGLLHYCASLMKRVGIKPILSKNNQTFRLDHPDGPQLVKDESHNHKWLGVHIFNHMRNWAEMYLITHISPSNDNEQHNKNRYNVGRSFDNFI